jgi:hypothetical protein
VGLEVLIDYQNWWDTLLLLLYMATHEQIGFIYSTSIFSYHPPLLLLLLLR